MTRNGIGCPAGPGAIERRPKAPVVGRGFTVVHPRESAHANLRTRICAAGKGYGIRAGSRASRTARAGQARAVSRLRPLPWPELLARLPADTVEAAEDGARRWATAGPRRPGPHQLLHRPVQRKTTVLWPLSSTRRSQCQRTARESASASASWPTVASARGSKVWSMRMTSCSMMGPSSRSAVT
jgi:hypothetical protein